MAKRAASAWFPTEGLICRLQSVAECRAEATALLYFSQGTSALAAGVTENSSDGDAGAAPRPGWRLSRWSFAEVWARASAAAAALRRQRGARPGSRVGVAVDEGPSLPLLELAILLAGCAVVPLDPCDPPPRLASILADADVWLAVAKDSDGLAVLDAASSIRSQAQDGGAARPEFRALLVAEVIDAAASDGSQRPQAAAEAAVQLGPEEPDAVSHVFFTSGSTGRPKGCVVKLRALASYCAARNETYGVGEDAVCFVASAHTFDPSLGDLLATWAAGGCAAYAPRAELFAQLGPVLAAVGATHLCCTPSLLATLTGTRHGEPGALPRLRCLALGGEKAPQQLLRLWASGGGGAGGALQLWNTYGVTECCVYNSARRMAPEDSPSLIGAALSGNVLRVVIATDGETEDAEGESLQDQVLEEVTPGTVGELLIAGAQVGEGYAKRPALTERRFRSHGSLGRCYLTGDLARLDTVAGGGRAVVLLGRRDNQVKLRGHRVELAEVEQWLLAAAGPLLRAAAAACLEGQLVAFCVPAQGLEAPRPAELLRAALRWLAGRGAMPPAMRPQRYVLLEKLPLTSSGKVARGRLAESEPLGGAERAPPDEQPDERSRSQAEEGLVGLEAVVADAWAAELSHPRSMLGRQSHFQELGGHSIVALRVCRRLLLQLARPGHGVGSGEGPEGLDVASLEDDLGELSGALAPAALLSRPVLADYAAHLAHSGCASSLLKATADGGAAPGDEEAKGASCQEEVPEPEEGEQHEAVSLLHRAAGVGAVPLIDFLVAGGHAPVDGGCSMRRLRAATRAQRSLRHVGRGAPPRPPAPLHTAAASSQLASTTTLLRLRASVTATDAHGVMSLHLAAASGTKELVAALLDAGAPLSCKDMNLQTVLHFAARSGNTGTMELLLQRWLADAALLALGAKNYGGLGLDWRDRWHRTPVHWAALNDRAEALALLLESKAAASPPRVPCSKHAKNTTLRHESPLEIAQRRGHARVIGLLEAAHGAAAPPADLAVQ